MMSAFQIGLAVWLGAGLLFSIGGVTFSLLHQDWQRQRYRRGRKRIPPGNQ